MNKYAQTALKAAHYVELGEEPLKACEEASRELFKIGSSAQKKGCPKNAFLGLYGGKGKNAEYARKGLAYLHTYGGDSVTEKDL